MHMRIVVGSATLHRFGIQKFYTDTKDAILLRVQSNIQCTKFCSKYSFLCMSSACVFSNILNKQPAELNLLCLRVCVS